MRHPKYGSLRRHQHRVTTLVPEIVARVARPTTFVNTTPGGGKTLAGAIYVNEVIDADLADVVIWVVPGNALLDQVQDGFYNPERGLFRKLAVWGRKGQKVGQRSTGGHDCVGYVITYSTTAKTIRAILRTLRGKRIVLILDEFHHIGVKLASPDDDENDSGHVRESVRKSWKAASDLLAKGFDVTRRNKTTDHVDGAAYMMLMSGTAWRHDGLDLPYLDDHRDSTGALVADIDYSRYDALEEHAVLPMLFELITGEVSYEHRGKTKTVRIEDADGVHRAKALRAFLDADATWRAILDRCAADWRRYREEKYRSRMLILARNRKDARRAAAYLRDVLKVGEVTLAIGDEPNAHREIQRFRSGSHGDVLVTVRMAYEGFDVANITHVACLTNVRSVQFFDQCFNRATRVNQTCGLPWEEQAAYIFLPCDVASQKYVATIHADQRRLVEGGHAEGARLIEATRTRAERATFRTLGAVADGARLGGEKGLLSQEQSELVGRARSAVAKWKDWDPFQILAAIGALSDLQKGAAQ